MKIMMIIFGPWPKGKASALGAEESVFESQWPDQLIGDANG